jgi:hypothetical protein
MIRTISRQMADSPALLTIAPPRGDSARSGGASPLPVGRVHTETDLLVAALQDHVRDLQRERAMLRDEVGKLRADLAHAHSVSIWGRMKPVRGSHR